MNCKEFNEKYKDYLEDRYYSLAIDTESVVIFLDKIFEGLIKILEFKYHQIKLKFGSCRFYTNLSEVTSVHLNRLISGEVEQHVTSFCKNAK